jgi:hypothetical protein
MGIFLICKDMTNKQITQSLISFIVVIVGMATFAINPGTAFAETTSTELMSVFKPTSHYAKQIVVGAATVKPVDQELIDGERIQRLENYFTRRDMPLAGHGAEFVEAAKKCKIDWRLLPAIGVRESSGGKHLLNNNPFGWGSAKIKFADFTDAIDGVSDNLCGFNPNTARYYGDKTTFERLWAYNGTVMPTYPKEVMDIMDMM